jgi:hypothetical protein
MAVVAVDLGVPKFGLPVDPATGHPMHGAGSVEEPQLIVNYGVNQIPTGTTRFGPFKTYGCNVVYLWINIKLGTADPFKFYASCQENQASASAYVLARPIATAGSRDLAIAEGSNLALNNYTYTSTNVSQVTIVPFPNPGAPFMSISVVAAGTLTTSTLNMKVARSWGQIHIPYVMAAYPPPA